MSFPRSGYKETVESHLGHPLFLTLREASCHVVSCPMEKSTEQGPELGSTSGQ